MPLPSRHLQKGPGTRATPSSMLCAQATWPGASTRARYETHRSEGSSGPPRAAGPPPSLLQSGCHQLLYTFMSPHHKMGTRVVTPVELRAACKGVIGVGEVIRWVHTVPLPLSLGPCRVTREAP